MQRIKQRLRDRNRALGSSFHAQADYAVIGVFLLELLHTAIILAAPLALVAIVRYVFWGGE
jgi:hypothetical protein